MKQRDQRGRYKKVYRKASRWEVLTLYSVLGGILFGIVFDVVNKPHVFEVVRAQTVEDKVVIVAQEVLLEVAYTEEDIIRHIRKAFPEDPNTAVAIAECESGLVPDIRSQHTLSYGQERSYGLFQIHSPVWHYKALELGYNEYRTSVEDNIAMARYIYEQSGKKWTAWSCYTKKMI